MNTINGNGATLSFSDAVNRVIVSPEYDGRVQAEADKISGDADVLLELVEGGGLVLYPALKRALGRLLVEAGAGVGISREVFVALADAVNEATTEEATNLVASSLMH